MEALGPHDPEQVGAYRLLARLGGGGMGTVYLGRTAGGRNVAVKLIRGEYADDDAFRRRFRQEVDAARQVSGRWTPPVLDADTEGPQPWVATAYVPGPDLAQALRHFGALPVPTVRVLGAGLAEGLVTVHRLGLVHRDVKPSNVLLALDGPHLIDFGITRALDGSATALTRSGHVIGSPGYMSPEQAAGRTAGPPSDVFSLGVVLTAAATGRNPFGEGVTAAVLLYRVLHEKPDLDDLPDALRDVVTSCLGKNPDHRPTPRQVRERLLPDPDATVLQGGWLPPAISQSVARHAADVLDMDAPGPTPPPPPPGRTTPVTLLAPPSPPAPPAAPAAVRRPQGRTVALAALVTAVVTAAAAWLVTSNSGAGNAAGGSSTEAAATASDAVPTGSATASPSPSSPSSPSASGDVPDAFIGSWSPSGIWSDGDPVTLTIRRGRLGTDVGTVVGTDSGLTCRATLRLTDAEPSRITLVNTAVSGGSKCGTANSSTPWVLTPASTTVLHLSLDGTSGPDLTRIG